jgi:hypothetical protein
VNDPALVEGCTNCRRYLGSYHKIRPRFSHPEEVLEAANQKGVNCSAGREGGHRDNVQTLGAKGDVLTKYIASTLLVLGQ